MSTSLTRRVGIGLSLLAVVEILSGFGTQTLIVGIVGANRISDAYFVAVAVPQFFLTVVAAPVVNVLIPLLAPIEHDQARARATVTLAWVTGAAGASAVLAGATSMLWMPLLFPSFTGDESSLVLNLVIVQLLAMAPTAGCMIWKAACYSRRRFLAAEAVSVSGAVLAFGTLVVLVPRYGVMAAVWVNLARFALTLVGLLLLERTTKPEPMRGKFAGELWHRTRPLMFGALYFKSEPIVDQHFASMAQPGDLSMFSFGRTLLTSGLQVLSQALIAPIIPELAVLAKRGEWRQVRSRMHQRMLFLGGAATLAMVFVAVVGPYALDAIASLSPRAAAMPLHTLWVLLLLLAGIPIAAGATQIVTATYYALGETRLLTGVGIVGYTVGIAFKFAGFHLYGLWGLAAATSVYYFLDTTLQWVVLERLIARAIKKLPASETAAPSGPS